MHPQSNLEFPKICSTHLFMTNTYYKKMAMFRMILCSMKQKKKDVKGDRHFWKCSTHSLIYENEACGSHLLPTTNKPEKCANLSTIWRIMNRTQREKQQARNYLIFKEFHLFCDIYCCLNWIIKWNKSHFWHERAIIIIKFLLSSSLSSRKVDYLSLLLIIISSMFQTINSKKLYEWINDRRASLNDE